MRGGCTGGTRGGGGRVGRENLAHPAARVPKCPTKSRNVPVFRGNTKRTHRRRLSLRENRGCSRCSTSFRNAQRAESESEPTAAFVGKTNPNEPNEIARKTFAPRQKRGFLARRRDR